MYIPTDSNDKISICVEIWTCARDAAMSLRIIFGIGVCVINLRIECMPWWPLAGVNQKELCLFDKFWHIVDGVWYVV